MEMLYLSDKYLASAVESEKKRSYYRSYLLFIINNLIHKLVRLNFGCSVEVNVRYNVHYLVLQL